MGLGNFITLLPQALNPVLVILKTAGCLWAFVCSNKWQCPPQKQPLNADLGEMVLEGEASLYKLLRVEQIRLLEDAADLCNLEPLTKLIFA